jgi:hypothetical protein
LSFYHSQPIYQLANKITVSFFYAQNHISDVHDLKTNSKISTNKIHFKDYTNLKTRSNTENCK